MSRPAARSPALRSAAAASSTSKSGGTASGTTVGFGGVEHVGGGETTGGTAIGSVVGSGGEQDVYASATASGAVIDSGGYEYVGADGLAVGTMIDSGGSAFVDTGGTASAAMINGGTFELGVGALASDTIDFTGTGGLLKVDDITDLTLAPATIVAFRAGDTIDLTAVSYDGTGSATLLAPGNVLAVAANGTTSDVDFDPSQAFIGYGFDMSPDSSGGTDLTLVAQPLTSSATIPAGQIAYDVPVANGGSLTVLGTLVGGTVGNGATVDVVNGGTTDGTSVGSGGTFDVSNGAIAYNTSVGDGGTFDVSSGGLALNGAVKGLGLMRVEYAAAAGSTKVYGNTLIVASGGTVSNTVLSGGELDDYGTASATEVDSGGLEIVEWAASRAPA